MPVKEEANLPIRGGAELRYANDFVVTSIEQEVANIPWRNAIDVWIWGVGVAGTGIEDATWRMYAVSGQTRILISRTFSATGGSPDPNAYIMGVRDLVCDRFQITVQGVTGVADGTVPGRVSVTGFGVEPSGPPRTFPSTPPNQTNQRTNPLAWFGGDYGAGALEVQFKGAITGAFGAGPALLVETTGFSEAAATRYIQFFETLVVPADGSVASVYTIKVPAGASFSWQPIGGRWFPTGFTPIPPFTEGLSFANSSTPFVLTRAGGAEIYLNMRAYRAP